MKDKKSISKFSKIIIGLLLTSFVTLFSVFGYLYYKLSLITDKDFDNSVTSTTDYKTVDGITNILLVGIDARNIDDTSRSDSMIIATIDNINKDIKLTSLARDTYVNIPNKGMQKLTHAYAYGGIKPLIETIESNFEIDIDHYSIVNFNSFIDIIDTIGGISVDIDEGNIKELNKIIKDSYLFMNDNNKDEMKLIKDSGLQKLNGYQALAYARIRKQDSAFKRDERQREIIESLINELKELPVTKYNSLLNSILPNVKTDMTPKDILNLGYTIVSMPKLNIKQLEFPLLNYTDGRVRGNDGWVLDFKRELCLKVLHDFIFEDILYTDSELIELNKEIKSSYNSGVSSVVEKSTTNSKNSSSTNSNNSSNNNNSNNSSNNNNSNNNEDSVDKDSSNNNNDNSNDNLNPIPPIEPSVPTTPSEPTEPTEPSDT